LDLLTRPIGPSWSSGSSESDDTEDRLKRTVASLSRKLSQAEKQFEEEKDASDERLDELEKVLDLEKTNQVLREDLSNQIKKVLHLKSESQQQTKTSDAKLQQIQSELKSTKDALD